MNFKDSKLHKILIKALIIAVIVGCVFSVSTIFFLIMGFLSGQMTMGPLEVIFAVISFVIFSILFTGGPVAFIYFCIAAINEFVKSEYKTKKTLLIILAINFIPVTVLFFLFTLPKIFNLNTTFGTFAGISWGLGIPCSIFLFISIPVSIIFLIVAVVQDLINKFNK